MKTYNVYNDPGHGWMKVNRKELESLGIADKITGYSYMRGESVYLEEDCDMQIFLTALRLKFGEFNINDICKDHYSDKQSKIRNYDNYEFHSQEIKDYKEKMKDIMLNLKDNWSKKAIKEIKNANVSKLNYWQIFYNISI